MPVLPGYMMDSTDTISCLFNQFRYATAAERGPVDDTKATSLGPIRISAATLTLGGGGCGPSSWLGTLSALRASGLRPGMSTTLSRSGMVAGTASRICRGYVTHAIAERQPAAVDIEWGRVYGVFYAIKTTKTDVVSRAGGL